MYLSLDLGTSGLKGLLINDTGRLVGSSTAPLAVLRPHEAASPAKRNPCK